MIPYLHGRLRCDPMWTQVVNKDDGIGNLTATSNKIVEFQCSECNATFDKRIDHFYTSSGRCQYHRQCINKNRPRYDGVVPLHLLRLIRAGLLQEINREVLIQLVAEFDYRHGQTNLINEPNIQMASRYMDDIEKGHYGRVELLDSAFWWDDSHKRKNNQRYVPPPKKPRVSSATVTPPVNTVLVGITDVTPFAVPIACTAPPAGHPHDNIIKQEPRNAAFFHIDVGLCGDPYCRNLMCRVHRTAATNSPGEKRKQRNEMLRAVDAARRAAWGSRRGVNGWWLDDTMVNPDGTVTSLTMEALANTNADVDDGGADLLRIFSPNLKRCMVDHLRALDPHHRPGTVVAGVGCACAFLRHWAEEIRIRAPLDVIMVDGFGGIDNNVLRIVHLMVELRLFRPGAGVQPGVPPVQMMVVFSDRYDRAETGSVMAAVIKALVELPKLFSVCPYALTIHNHHAYGATMHVIECMVTDREWVHTDLDGFTGRVLYTASSS